MGWLRKRAVMLMMCLLMLVFVQYSGGYLIEQLSQYTGVESDGISEKRIKKQMVLPLEPVEYYTYQIGAFPYISEAQSLINRLAEMGYRVGVSKEVPYKLRLGCMGIKPELNDLPEEIQKSCSDAFVEKRILNETTMKFLAEDEIMEKAAVIISSYDVVLKHSLQMFQDFRYETCSVENWAAMTEQICVELDVLQKSAEIFCHSNEQEPETEKMKKILECTETYQKSLERMQTDKNDRVVLLAQSCLMELIEHYHEYIKDVTHPVA